MYRDYSCYATAAFGLEGLVAAELRELNMKNVAAENGGVRFTANISELFQCNLSLSVCDRVFILVGERKCDSFESLYQLVLSLPWEEYVNGAEAFNISAKCARSRLMSPRDCQSISKKAILDRLRKTRKQTVFPENGSPFFVLISIHSDLVRVMLNVSGDALSRRGYRTWNGEAPLRETLASALIRLSPWKPNQALYDPCCGTGTILVEAAMKACGRVPCLARAFAMEKYAFCSHHNFSMIRQKAVQSEKKDILCSIGGSDIDSSAVELARRHAKQAGMSDRIQLTVKPLQDLTMAEEHGVFICNPPYGERIGDQKTCHALYHDLHDMQSRNPGWVLCAISSDPSFERFYGKRADRRRRLYNGRLECTYYTFYRP